MRACVSVIGPPGTAHTLLQAVAGVKGCSSRSPLTGASSAAGARRQGACRGALRPTPKALSPAGPCTAAKGATSSLRGQPAHIRQAVGSAGRAAGSTGSTKPPNEETISLTQVRRPGGKLWAHQICFQLPHCCTRIAVPCMLILLGGEQMMKGDCRTVYQTQVSG